MIANALKRSDGNINYPGLIAAWSAKGKTNDDKDRATLKDLTGNGHDITLNGFAFSEMSGYGGYTQNFNNFQSRRNSSLYKSENKITFSPIDIISETYCSVNIGERFYNPKKTILNIYNLPENDKTYLKITIKDVNGRDIMVLYINKNGIYNLDIVEFVDGTTDRNLIFTLYNPISTDGITIEQVPEYPDALVFDGVDDYGINEDMPILDDFTLITKIYSFNTYPSRGIITKDDGDYTKGIFSIRQGSVLVKGVSNAINFTNGITYLNLNTYNGNSINVGTGEDVSTINIGCIRHGDYFSTMAFYSAYLFDRSLDEQEIKAFIRKYIDPEYLLPSEILTPDCYYDFSKGSNDDETHETIKDYSGNGNDAVAHNFAWSGMSGYGGNLYGNYKYHFDTLGKYQNIVSKTPVIGNLKFKVTGLTDYFNKTTNYIELTLTRVSDGRTDFKQIKEDGEHNIELPTSKYSEISIRSGGINIEDDACNIDIEMLPEYPGALVFDGVDDYVSLDAFDSGFKTMFIECSYVSLNTILYDQRKVGTEQEDCINTSAYEAGFYGRNKYGKTYINGVYNKPDSTLIASKLSNKHILITSTLKGDYTSTPCIASSNVNKGMYCNMALYKFLGFKEALTEEQIQAVIKKYKLLDGVDEIEVS